MESAKTPSQAKSIKSEVL